MTRNKKKTLYIIGGILLFLALIIGGSALWVSQHYKTIIKEKLPGWMATSTDSLYHISVSDIGINVFTSSVTFHKVHIWVDSGQVNKIKERGYGISTYINISIPVIKVQNISWRDLISDKNISCGTLLLGNADAQIIHLNIPPDSTIKPKTEPAISRLFAEKIDIQNANVSYTNVKNGDSNFYKLTGGDIVLNKWLLEPRKPVDTARFAFAETATVSFRSFSSHNTKGLYNIKCGNIHFNSSKDSCSIDSFNLEPAVSESAFYRTVGHQLDMFHVNFPSVTLSGFMWSRLMSTGALYAKNMGLKYPSIEIYYSRLPPPNTASKLGKYPNQLLLKMKLPLHVEKINIEKGFVKYTEVSSVTQKAGSIAFSNVKGSVTNITNIPELVSQNSNCVLSLNGTFNGGPNVRARFNLSLKDTLGNFAVDATLRGLEGKHVTEVAKNLGLAEIKSLHVSKMDIHVDGDQSYAQGNLTMLYTDMEVQLDKMNEDSTRVKKRKFLSFVANKVVLFPANPMPGKEVRTGSSYIKRDIHKSFFNAIWKNIYEGAKQTALRNAARGVLKQTDKKNKKSLWSKISGKK